MLMGSHILLALRSSAVPVSGPERTEFLTGAIAPDVRYMQDGLPRQATHSAEARALMPGWFAHGYEHHLAVDHAFYTKCESSGLAGRLGALLCSIIVELYAIRRLPDGVTTTLPGDMACFENMGVAADNAQQFFTICDAYFDSRDPDKAISLLASSFKDRAGRYLTTWHRRKRLLGVASWVLSPWIAAFLNDIERSVEQHNQ